MNPLLTANRLIHTVRFDDRSIEMAIDYLSHTFLGNIDAYLHFLHEFMKELEQLPSEDVIPLALKGLRILSPVCERFSLYNEKNRLDSLCFSLSNPPAYERLHKDLGEYKAHAEQWIRKAVSILNKHLSSKGYRCNIMGRYKQIYSVHEKLTKMRMTDASKLADLFGIRILSPTNNEEDCYAILNHLHDHFSPVVPLFKDYIVVPKINGYQSLHTGLKNLLEEYPNPIEIQIRTPIMHAFAEKGLAAHWVYSQKKESRLIQEKESRLKQNLDSHKDFKKTRITLLSYQGDLLEVESGASALDFAYLIHSELGQSASHAIINGKKQNLSTILQEMDIVQIVGKLTKKTANHV